MVSGGKRTGAGRPKGSNVYGESTSPVRIPNSRIEEIKAYLESDSNYAIPLYNSSVRAGSPTPADDSIDAYINLNSHLIDNPKTVFLVTASGDSMIDASINHGDMLIVDKSINPTANSIVVASVAGDLTVKRLLINGTRIQLKAENIAYPPIDIAENDNLIILGVVTFIIHKAN
jgi:DNA polymerase V